VYHRHVQLLEQHRNGGKLGTKAAAKESLTAHGWSKKLSPLWELLWMRTSFYSCFAICVLHNQFLGLVKVFSFVLCSPSPSHA
jgi:hypothetical protein